MTHEQKEQERAAKTWLSRRLAEMDDQPLAQVLRAALFSQAGDWTAIYRTIERTHPELEQQKDAKSGE